MESSNNSSHFDLSEEKATHPEKALRKEPYAELNENNNNADLTVDQPVRQDDDFNKALYDPRPHEDEARRKIAYWLLGILSVLLIWILGLVSLGTITIEQLKEFSIILGPVITLVSAATGFYYGTKQT